MASRNLFAGIAFVVTVAAFAPICAEADAVLEPWTQIATLPSTLSGHRMITVGDYWYGMEGYQGSSDTGTLYSRFNADGTVGAWLPTSERTLHRYWDTAASFGNYAYLIGGESGGGGGYDMTTIVEYAHIESGGTLSQWQQTNSLSQARYGAAAAAYNGYLYVMGGAANAAGISSVEYAKIQSDGSLGTWQPASSLQVVHPFTTGLAKDGYLYVFGGENNDYMTAAVERAQILPDGSLGGWQYDRALPAVRGGHGLASVGENVFIVGGNAGPYGNNPYDSVLWSTIGPIDPEGHTLSPWQTTEPLPQALAHCLAGTWDGHLYVTGGTSTRAVFMTGVVPEPFSLAFMASAFVGVIGYRLRQRSRGKGQG